MRAARSARRRVAGFTLLEVLVALAVFGVSAAAILRQTHQGLAQQLALEQRSTALWLAEDRLTVLAASGSQAPLGRSVEEVAEGDQRWRVTTQVDTTAMAQLRRVEVSVAPAVDERGVPRRSDDSYALVRLVTFQGES